MFRGAVIGNFVTGSSTPELQDLLALAPPTFSAVGTGRRREGVPRAEHARRPRWLERTGVDLDGLVDCSLNKTGRLCLDLAHYVAFPTGPQHDVVIGIDKSNAAVMVDPWGTSAIRDDARQAHGARPDEDDGAVAPAATSTATARPSSSPRSSRR